MHGLGCVWHAHLTPYVAHRVDLLQFTYRDRRGVDYVSLSLVYLLASINF